MFASTTPKTSNPVALLILTVLLVWSLTTIILMQTSLWESAKNLDRFPTAVAELTRRSQPMRNVFEDTSCQQSNSSIVRPFGSFMEVPPDACAIKLNQGKFSESVTQDSFGYRLPFYARDASRIYRCGLVSMAAETILADEKSRIVSEDEFKDAQKNCSSTGLVEPMIRLLAEKSRWSYAEARSSVESWIDRSDSGKLALEAIRRIGTLLDRRTKREFYLIEEEDKWRNALPSTVGQAAFPDVNTHKMELPPRYYQTMYMQNGRIEKNGRIATETMEVFYPKRAPYSHIALLQHVSGPNLDQFSPSVNSRKQLEATLRADLHQRSKCLSEVRSDGEKFSCGFSDIAVSKVLVISQTLGSQMFHHMSENLPRIGAYLDLLKRDPSIFVHVACPENAGYCAPLLEMLGVPKHRLVRGPNLVLAKTVIVPEGGRRHWPLGNLWGLMTLRKKVLAEYFAKEPTHQLSTGIRICVIKRTMTRLPVITSSWYNKIAADLRNDGSLALNFPGVLLNVSLFDDKDGTVMKSARAQIAQLRNADIVVGAHGAALSWITYARSGSHFISFRSRTNSDIYEHMSLGMGVAFHHIQFKAKYDLLYSEIRQSVGTAVSELLKKDQNKDPLFVAVACVKCNPSKASLMARYFDLVVLFDVTLPKDHEPLPQNVLIGETSSSFQPGDKEECFGHFYEELLEKAYDFLKGKRRNIYYGWVRNDDVMINPSYRDFWVTMERFDGLFIVDSTDASHPMAAFVHSDTRQRLCFSDGVTLTKTASELSGGNVAVIVSSLTATASVSNGCLFAVPKSMQEQEKMRRFADYVDENGEYATGTEKQSKELRSMGYFIMLKKRKSHWAYRSPPLAVFNREPPSGKTLGAFGPVRMVEVPFASFGKLACSLPVEALTNSIALDSC